MILLALLLALGSPDENARAGSAVTFYRDVPISASSPGTPPAGFVRLYSKDASGTARMYWKDDQGTEHDSTATNLPSGLIMLSLTTCPAGFTEETSLSGKFVLGTLAANADVTTTGGSNSVTPSGTVSAPTFTGSSGTVPAETFTGSAGTVPAQTFTGSSATTSAVSAGTPAGTNGATATSGNCAATNLAIGTGATTACKATAPNLTVPAETFTGSALATHTHTLTATGTNGTASFTPAGTNGTVSFTPAGTNSVPTFTGNALDPRPAYLKVIFCRAN